MGAFSNTAQQDGRRWFVWLSLLAMSLSLLTGLFLWRSVETSSVVVVQEQVEALRPMLTGFRIMAIALKGRNRANIPGRVWTHGVGQTSTDHHDSVFWFR